MQAEQSPAEAISPALFMGAYSPRIDTKGRVIMPAKFAPALQSGLVLTRGQERCLYLFAKHDFTSLYTQMQQQHVPGRTTRSNMRLLLAGAYDEDLDAQRRLLIPAALREYAGLEAELAVLGVGNHVEIWDATTWQKYLAAEEESFSDSDWALPTA